MNDTNMLDQETLNINRPEATRDESEGMKVVTHRQYCLLEDARDATNQKIINDMNSRIIALEQALKMIHPQAAKLFLGSEE